MFGEKQNTNFFKYSNNKTNLYCLITDFNPQAYFEYIIITKLPQVSITGFLA